MGVVRDWGRGVRKLAVGIRVCRGRGWNEAEVAGVMKVGGELDW